MMCNESALMKLIVFADDTNYFYSVYKYTKQHRLNYTNYTQSFMNLFYYFSIAKTNAICW